MIHVFLSRQIYDDPEDCEEVVLKGTHLIDIGSAIILDGVSGSFIYDISYDIKKEFIKEIKVVN